MNFLNYRHFQLIACLLFHCSLLTVHYSLAQSYPQYIPFHKGDKWGYCDSGKNIIIQPRYESLDLYNHGHSRILINNRWGFIDSLGNEFLLPDSVSFISYYGEFILVSNGKKNA